MAVRKRTWTTSGGEQRTAWVVDYLFCGKRRTETFRKKKDADQRHDEVRGEVRNGVHVARSDSVTVAVAGRQWIDTAEADGLQRSTVKTYREHLRLHIEPVIGHLKLSGITVPVVAKFRRDLQRRGVSASMVKAVTKSLGSILGEAQVAGLCGHNAVRELPRSKRQTKATTHRSKKLVVGVDIPTTDEVAAIINNAPARFKTLLMVVAFTGLRASELRGLRWCDVDLDGKRLHVRQRADRWSSIDRPKSGAGERVIPFGSTVAKALRQHKLASKFSRDKDLVFGTIHGNVFEHSNLVKQSMVAASEAAGLPYSGFHALRHFYASWCINRVEDGGLGLPPKNVQDRLGHSTIQMTLDTYGHLFKSVDDDSQDAAERALLSAALA